MPDSNFAPSRQAFDASTTPCHESAGGVPQLSARFLQPAGFLWGRFTAPDGARLGWGHLPAPNPHVECVMVGGFSECIEKYFETTADLAARGLSVWCLDWRGQGDSDRPRRWPSRPRPRRYDRDAGDLALFFDPPPAASLPPIFTSPPTP